MSQLIGIFVDGNLIFSTSKKEDETGNKIGYKSDSCNKCNKIFIQYNMDDWNTYCSEDGKLPFESHVCQTCRGIPKDKQLQFCKCGHIYINHWEGDWCFECDDNECMEFRYIE